MHVRSLTVAVLTALLLAACGGSEQGADSTDAAAGDAVTGDTHGVEVGGELGSKPTITVPSGEPPEELVVVDLVEGEGEEVAAGATVTIHYAGVSWLNGGEEFDASWNGGQPATFPLGQLIPGWQEGIPGMKPGGRRLLIIPPEQAYGPSGRPPAIAPNDTLVFVIDMLEAA